MKTIGIIGGLGPEATTDYYKRIIRSFDSLPGNVNLNYPEIIIYSVNMSKFIGFLNDKKYVDAACYIGDCIEKLRLAGADFAVISANTPHLLFQEITERTALPLVSLIEVVRTEAESMNLKKAGLIGTRFTMQSDFYSRTFKGSGIAVIVPAPEEIEIIHHRLFSELEHGIFRDETRSLLLDIIGNMIRDAKIDSLILGCTEFPLLFTEPGYLGIPFLNTTAIHVKAIIENCLNK